MKLKKILSMTLRELALNTELESPDLEPGKRKKIEARLQKLRDEKNSLIDGKPGLGRCVTARPWAAPALTENNH